MSLCQQITSTAPRGNEKPRPKEESLAERIERVDEEQEKLERRRSGSRKPNMDQHEGLVLWASQGMEPCTAITPHNNAFVTGSWLWRQYIPRRSTLTLPPLRIDLYSGLPRFTGYMRQIVG